MIFIVHDGAFMICLKMIARVYPWLKGPERRHKRHRRRKNIDPRTYPCGRAKTLQKQKTRQKRESERRDGHISAIYRTLPRPGRDWRLVVFPWVLVLWVFLKLQLCRGYLLPLKRPSFSIFSSFSLLRTYARKTRAVKES